MFPYTVKYTESEYDIQNSDLLCKIDQQCQNTFEIVKSKSIVYPPKQTRTDVSGHTNKSVRQCISFIKHMLFFEFHCIFLYIYIYIYLYIFLITIYIYIRIYLFTILI